MKRLSKPFPQPTTSQPTHPNVFEFGEILEQFHEDFHQCLQSITDGEDAKCRDVFEQIITNYVPYLTVTQWVRVLGGLVMGMYINCRTVQ